jgi:hypothetical protein
MAKRSKSRRMQMFGQVTVPPTPERIARGEMQTIEVEMFNTRDMATIDLRQTALDRFWRDMLLAPEGDLERGRARYDAGTKLAQLHEATGLRQRETGAYGPREGIFRETIDHDDRCECSACQQLNALGVYQAVVRMMQRASLGAALAVQNLCVFEIEAVDRLELIRGLDVLVRHWGLD